MRRRAPARSSTPEQNCCLLRWGVSVWRAGWGGGIGGRTGGQEPEVRSQRSGVRADSFQKRLSLEKKQPTLEKNSRLWTETADSGNGGCVFSRRNESAAVFTAFRNATSCVSGGGDMNRIRRGFHRVSQRV